MNIDPLVNASFATQLHLYLVLLALGLGFIVFARQKGTISHKILGRIWGGLMMVIAAQSFFISGTLGPIHLISAWVLICIPLAIRAIRKGNRRGHKIWMISTYVGSMFGAGIAATLIPGRVLYQVFFGG